ncbi:hypothetical protein Pla108_28040 [Botrimarina colliarenosi]|uniref:Outer membrane efflux protein n=1 Tax=Botrimarina colliarenosi TaxID=2528001 RepID=A0A5C6ACA5_9BACT|nr:hypothetical protein [Botrimarina colliarenosi]TWT97027.1 hypothetical protein Pla108_28040 [Botrimarina colliarenosi]
MRYALLALLLSASVSIASAHENQCYECGGDSLASARAAQVAAMEQRLYRRFEHPARMRRIRAEIAYAEARIASLRRLQSQYDRVNRFGTGNALTMSAEQVRLDLLRKDMVLRDLRDQLILEQRYYRQARIDNAATASYATQRITAHVAVTPEAGEPTITIVNH